MMRLVRRSRAVSAPTVPVPLVWRRPLFLVLSALLAGSAALVHAQSPQAPSPSAAAAAARAEAGEPRASTSAQDEAGEPRAATSPSAPTETAARPGGQDGQRSSPPGTVRPAAKGGAPATKSTEPRAGKPGAVDRLDLRATVTGDSEQPKVMYIVPWKKSDIGDLSGKPMNSLLDEALAPVDRDEFKREVIYYNVVKSDATQNGAPTPAAKGEK